MAGEHAHVFTHGFDRGCPDEDGRNLSILALDGDLRLEGVDLTSVRIPANAHVHGSETHLIVPSILDAICEKNHPCTGSQHGQTTVQCGSKWSEQLRRHEEIAHRRTLTPG